MLRYKKGESLIPSGHFNFLCKYNKLKNVEKEIILFEPNWGEKLGGKKNYEKNKWIFELGRKKRLDKCKKDDKRILNIDLGSPELAEFIGVLIGDGFIGSYGSNRMIQITGHKINDKEYYKEYLIPLIKRIFDTNIHFYHRDTCIRLTIYSKVIFNTIRRTFNFPVGIKGDISIPKNLIQTEECKISLLRGLFDTDGSISLQRKKYPVISITTVSNKLAKQTQKLLNELGFGAYICKSKSIHKDAYRITLFGKQKVLKWRDLIGSSNPYHIKRINASVA